MKKASLFIVGAFWLCAASLSLYAHQEHELALKFKEKTKFTESYATTVTVYFDQAAFQPLGNATMTMKCTMEQEVKEVAPDGTALIEAHCKKLELMIDGMGLKVNFDSEKADDPKDDTARQYRKLMATTLKFKINKTGDVVESNVSDLGEEWKPLGKTLSYCGGILPKERVKIGEEWKSERTVEISQMVERVTLKLVNKLDRIDHPRGDPWAVIKTKITLADGGKGDTKFSGSGSSELYFATEPPKFSNIPEGQMVKFDGTLNLTAATKLEGKDATMHVKVSTHGERKQK